MRNWKRYIAFVTEKKENYDLITLVMVCLGDEEDENCKGLIRLLSVLLSTDKSADEKKEILETEFNIEMTKTMEEEAEKMGEFSKYVKEKSMQQGIQKGMQQAIKNLIKNANMTLEQAMAVLEVPENERVMYVGKIGKEHQSVK